MKNSTLIILLVIVVVLAGVLFLIPETDERQIENPSIFGFIFSIDENRALVAEGLSEGQAYEGETEQLEGEAYWITLTEETQIFDSQGNQIQFNDLGLGSEVEVFLDGPVMDSYPAQGGALKISLTGSFYEAENQTIGYIFAIDENSRILVAENLAPGVDEYTGMFDELEGNAVWFSITEDTEIINLDGDQLTFDELETNKRVEVYSTGPFLLSYPAQAGADRVVVTGNVFER